MRRSTLFALVTAILFSSSEALLAQGQTQPLARGYAPVGPTVSRLQLLTVPRPDTTPLQPAITAREFLSPVVMSQGRRRKGTALMIVGGAGILAGLLLEEDIITIAGAGVAGVGLYFYLR